MNRKKWIWVAAVLLLALTVWRWTPRSFDILMGTENGLEEIHLYLMALEIEDGKPGYTSYKLKTDRSDKDLLEILEGKGYRPNLRNLLPVRTDEISADPYIGFTCTVYGFWENGKCVSQMVMLDNNKCSVSASQGGFGVYHPVEKNVLETLGNYIMTHGTVQE